MIPKLARPNLFNPRIVLASCPQQPDGDADDDGLVAALRTRGLHARWLSWDDPQTETADLVILRSVRDRTERRDEFLAWTARVRNLLNVPAAVAWNREPNYLNDLAAAGIRVSEPSQLGSSQSESAARPVEAMSLVFLGGEESHAFVGAPVPDTQGETARLAALDTSAGDAAPSPANPEVEVWEFGHDVLDAAAAHLGMPRNELLYARVDLAGDGDDTSLLRLELIDPWLGWSHLDETNRDLRQRDFALQVESALERLGLGPLSH